MPKTTHKVIVVAALFFSGVIAVNYQALVGILDAGGYLPRPERYTELYFNDTHSLEFIKINKQHAVPFTIYNAEHQTATYNYAISAVRPGEHQATTLAAGTATITKNASRQISPTITLPELGPRVMLQVTISYQSIAFGQQAPSTQTQSIHYWLSHAESS